MAIFTIKPGREREFLGQYAFPVMNATPGAITDAGLVRGAATLRAVLCSALGWAVVLSGN